MTHLRKRTLAMNPLAGLPTIVSLTAKFEPVSLVGVTISPGLLSPPSQKADSENFRVLCFNLVMI